MSKEYVKICFDCGAVYKTNVKLSDFSYLSMLTFLLCFKTSTFSNERPLSLYYRDQQTNIFVRSVENIHFEVFGNRLQLLLLANKVVSCFNLVPRAFCHISKYDKSPLGRGWSCCSTIWLCQSNRGAFFGKYFFEVS